MPVPPTDEISCYTVGKQAYNSARKPSARRTIDSVL